MVFRDRFGGCPACTLALEDATILAAECLRCPSCRGLWLRTEVFERLLAEAAGEAVVPGLSQPGATTSRRCPECGMQTRRVMLEHIALEQCTEHGIWFDRMELERACSIAAEPPWVRVILAAAKAR